MTSQSFSHHLERFSKEVWITSHSVISHLQYRIFQLVKDTGFSLEVTIDKNNSKIEHTYSLRNKRDDDIITVKAIIYSKTANIPTTASHDGTLNDFKSFLSEIRSAKNNKKNQAIVEFIKAFTVMNSSKMEYSFESYEGQAELDFDWRQHNQKFQILTFDESAAQELVS